MDIRIGKQYINKTWRFLIPCLRGHGDAFVKKFNPVYKLAVGIHDSLLDGSSLSNGRNIYLMLDKQYKPREYQKFMEFLRYQDYFKGDYCPDSEIISSRKHIVIIEVPEGFSNSYDYFLKGKYSKMYSDEELKLFFSGPSRKKDYEILSKSGNALNEFVKNVNQEFNVSSSPKDFNGKELEFPLVKKEEIFNFEDNQTIYFNEKLDKVWH